MTPLRCVVLVASLSLASCSGYRAERHNREGNSHLEADKPREAVASFAAAVKLDPDESKYHFNLGLAYAKMRHLDEASRQFAEAVRLDPSDIEASRLLTLTNRAIAARSRPY